MRKGNKINNRGTLIIAVNEDIFFLSHRVDVAEGTRQKGWQVIVTCSDTGSAREITARGFIYERMPIAPRSLNPMDEWRVINYIARLLRKYPDAIVHFVGMKLILAGNLAIRISPHPKGIVNAVSGLGILFLNPRGMVQKSIFRILRSARNPEIPTRTIFQNFEDEEVFRKAKLLGKREAAYIKGSGVDLTQYQPATGEKDETDKITVLFAGRLLKSKGVEEFVAAAELLRPKWENKVEFLICGALSNSINAIPEEAIRKMTDDSYIVWQGHRSDMPDVLRNADIFVYPSYYREGVPRVLLEASASGLPIVACDSVGCRDTVEEGVNGYLVPVMSPAHIAEKVDMLLKDPSLRRELGYNSRRIAIRDYSIEEVVKHHIEIYSSLL